MNDLKETIELMTSSDYKERFKAEYYQLKIRYEKLLLMFNNWDNLNFKPTCGKNIYMMQLNAMKSYLDILAIRAHKEGILL